jgi:transketolase
MKSFDELDTLAVTALRMLAVDQVEAARSGHPGLPLGAAPMAYALWSRFLKHDPTEPSWPDRDRFVLSAGHGSALLYALLHVFGYDLPLDELKRFRQLGSRTPGHPEHGLTVGVEATTGPLGQGLAMAVGMALAERHLAARYNRDGHTVVDHRTWVIASDGDLMEGISHEAASLAGHHKLGKLVVLYDDNQITIEGATSLAWSDDVAGRFAAYRWRVLRVEDGNDLVAIGSALADAASQQDRPTLIKIKTHIGFGSPKQDTAGVHGSPLGPDAMAATRKAFGWEHPPFVTPDSILKHVRTFAAAGRETRTAWQDHFLAYSAAQPELSVELQRRLKGELPTGWEDALPVFEDGKGMATREASGQVLNALAPHMPELLGGSADLAPSTNTLLSGEANQSPEHPEGRNMHFGIRELGMAGVANGMALHGGIRPYVATFLVFSDYLRPALRLSAIQHQPVVYVLTHDSIALGEDGPTHQPVEHIVALRVIPNMVVLRPADARETAEAWRVALSRTDGPTALLLTRQKLPTLPAPQPGAVARGAFIRQEAGGGEPRVVLVATGSEVSLALAAREILEADGVPTRVVSAPSLELLARQDREYQRWVLGPASALKVAVEMGRGQGWHRWVGDGELIVMSSFGASAPADDLLAHFGFTPNGVVARVRAALVSRMPATLDVTMPAGSEPTRRTLRDRLVALAAPARLAARDSALWGEACARDVARRLGWLDLPQRSREILPELRALVAGLVADGVDTMVLVGMGGSSLCPEVLREVCGSPSGRTLIVLDTTDADRVAALLDEIVPARTVIVSVSKSGTTVETSSLTEILLERFNATLGDWAGRHFVALTEPGTALTAQAWQRHWRAAVAHPVDVGGRFSALTAVGLLPALWLGLDADAMLDQAATAMARLDLDHPGFQLGLEMATVCQQGWGKLAWCASPDLTPFGAWAEQLVAESTGKTGHGILPLPMRGAPLPEQALGGTLYLSARFSDEDTIELDQRLTALGAAGHPVVRWQLERDQLPQAFMVLEVATAVAGLLLGVNPFDEPDVVRAKERARAALATGHVSFPAVSEDPAAALLAHIKDLSREDAVVVLAYIGENAETAADLARLRAALAARLGVAVTTAFGPRYLHSTGQLHKGGPDRLSAVVLTSEPARDVPIPGQPHTLGQLRLAQAQGDLAALQDGGRRALHLHLGKDAARVLADLVRAVS